MTIDKQFIECELIAQQYETNLINVLDIYTTIEQQEKRENKSYDLKTIIIKTQDYFRLKEREIGSDLL